MTKETALKKIPYMQVAIYVMVGGGFVGESFARQPKTAYVDARLPKRPYSMRKIMAAKQALVEAAEIAGLDPDNLPTMADFTNMGGAF